MTSNFNAGLKGSIAGIVLAIVFSIIVLILCVGTIFVFTKYSDSRFVFDVIDLVNIVLVVIAAAVGGYLAGKSAGKLEGEGVNPVTAAAFTGLLTGIAGSVLFALLQGVQLLLLMYGFKNNVTLAYNFQTPFCLLGSCCYGPMLLVFCIAVSASVASYIIKKK